MQGLRAVLWPSGCRWEPAWDGFVWSIVDGVPVRVHCATLGHLLLKLLLPMPLSLCACVCHLLTPHAPDSWPSVPGAQLRTPAEHPVPRLRLKGG